VFARTACTVRRGGAGNGASATAPAPHPTSARRSFARPAFLARMGAHGVVRVTKTGLPRRTSGTSWSASSARSKEMVYGGWPWCSAAERRPALSCGIEDVANWQIWTLVN
jgi:hypothetical protein